MFKDLSQYSKDDSEKQELERLSQNDATHEIDLMKKEFKNIIEVMEEHKSIEMSPAVLLQLIPKMMPRYYTIASSALLSPTKVRIAISLSEYSSPSGKKFTGITSEYLKRVFTQSFQNKKEEVKSRIFIKDSLFKYPEDPKTPVVMVGPGTGVVPFIAFAEERQHLKEQTPDIELGEADLYFGCKERTEDYIYRDEIADFKSKGLITNVYEAFSREQENKVYVQDLIKQNQHEIKDVLMNKNGQFFMCGATAMGHSVETALENIFGEGGKDYLKKMKDEKRFAKELWSA
jgi:NADPH-ferrihemoprotein reductase